MIFRRKANGEKGAVLLTTLLLMTVMAAITIAIIDDINLSIKRTRAIQSTAQIDWYVRGGESFMQTWLQVNSVDEKQAELARYINANEAIAYPLDNGALTAQIGDGQNCFNLNQLASPTTGQSAQEHFTRLLRLLDFDSFAAETIVASVQDWVDSDNVPLPNGAEGLVYMGYTPPYHAANTFMVDITELRAVQGVTQGIYTRLSPFVCARNHDKPNLININTLNWDRAALLAIVFNHDNALRAAQGVIAARPELGYSNIEDIWAQEPVARLNLKGIGTDMVSLTTDQIVVDIKVSMGGKIRINRTLFEMRNGRVNLISRRSLQ